MPSSDDMGLFHGSIKGKDHLMEGSPFMSPKQTPGITQNQVVMPGVLLISDFETS
jgi:hypothetical protein